MPEAIVGHGATLHRLSESQAQVLWLFGPESVGKMSCTRFLAAEWGLQASSLWVAKLTAEAARAAIRFAMVAPVARYKLVVIRVDEDAVPGLNILLKLLEEPPEWLKVILVSSRPLPATVAGRCELHQFRPLTADEVRQVLVLSGMDHERASRLSAFSRGSVRTALSADTSGRSRLAVLEAVRGVHHRSPGQLQAALARWDADCSYLLACWAAEQVSQQWMLFAPGDVPGVHHEVARRILTGLAAVWDAAPRLAAATVLEPLAYRR